MLYKGEIVMGYLPTEFMLADGLSKMIDGVRFLEHKEIYTGLKDMPEKHGVKRGEKPNQLVAFKINQEAGEDDDITCYYMTCDADINP